MARVAFRKRINVSRVVAKIASTVIALYVGGTILTQLGTVMQCTQSPFYSGLNLIGWTISNSFPVNATSATCNTTQYPALSAGSLNNLITSTTASTGLLSVIGIIAVASIVLEFVQFKM